MARVSDDHAHESMSVAHLAKKSSGPRIISVDELRQHNGQHGNSFWAVIDGFVVDATDFIDAHPGGLKKLLSADGAAAGATGQDFGFSFSRGKNAHFPDTGRRFSAGVKRYLSLSSDSEIAGELPPAEIAFPPHGKVVILGKLGSSSGRC